jgi:hypothetical protein
VDSERKREEQRPVTEGGGGVSEGFEEAEEALIESAEHGDEVDPTTQAGELESDDSSKGRSVTPER